MDLTSSPYNKRSTSNYDFIKRNEILYRVTMNSFDLTFIAEYLCCSFSCSYIPLKGPRRYIIIDILVKVLMIFCFQIFCSISTSNFCSKCINLVLLFVHYSCIIFVSKQIHDNNFAVLDGRYQIRSSKHVAHFRMVLYST